MAKHHLEPKSEYKRSWSEHRKPLPTKDEQLAERGPAFCPKCYLIWHNKRWQVETPKLSPLLDRPDLRATLCPACRQIELKHYDGEVVLHGKGIGHNPAALLGLIHHTEHIVRSDNPLNRIAALEVGPDAIALSTVGTFLAERIGKEVGKAFGGTLSIVHLEDERYVRVSWTQP